MLQLARHHLEAIHAHAESTYPEECCGLLLGTSDLNGKTVVAVQATVNAWTMADNIAGDRAGDGKLTAANFTKTRRYAIAPADLLATMRAHPDRDIVGIYHSHPDRAAVPSECDRQLAWPQYSYLIAAVHQGRVVDALSWCLDDYQQFQSEEMLLDAAAIASSARM